MSSEQLTQEALALPIKERVRLAQRLWDSLAEGLPGKPLSDDELVQLARERCREFDSGEEPEIPYNEVMEAARKALQ